MSRKYKKKLLKCYELLDKITSSLTNFEVLISLSLDDDTVLDAKEFHKLQTLYLQLMTCISSSSLRTSSNVGAVGAVGGYCFPVGAVGGYCFPVGVYCEWVEAIVLFVYSIVFDRKRLLCR